MSETPKNHSHLPVVTQTPKTQSSSAKAEPTLSISRKGSWLSGILGSKKGETDFVMSTSLVGMVKRAKRMKSAAVVFVALDIVLIWVLLIVWAKR